MKNDTLRLIPRSEGDSIIKKELYKITFKCYNLNRATNTYYFCDMREYSIWKSIFGTYIVKLWSGAKCNEYCEAYKFMQYNELNKAWQYKRTCMKNIKNQYDKIVIEEEVNYDNYLQELDR